MNERALALATDLYEPTMAAADFANRVEPAAIRSLSVRNWQQNSGGLQPA